MEKHGKVTDQLGLEQTHSNRNAVSGPCDTGSESERTTVDGPSTAAAATALSNDKLKRYVIGKAGREKPGWAIRSLPFTNVVMGCPGHQSTHSHDLESASDLISSIATSIGDTEPGQPRSNRHCRYSLGFIDSRSRLTNSTVNFL